MRKLLLAVAVLLLAWAAIVVPLPLAALEPVQALPVQAIVELEEGPGDQIPDELLFTAIQLAQPTTVGAVRILLDEHRELTTAPAVAPPGMDPDQFQEFQRRLFRESVRAAVAMGAEAAGHDVTVTGDGARVVATVPGAPADAVLQQEDVIVAIDDEPVSLASEVAAMLGNRDAGDQVTLTIVRDDDELSETLELAPLDLDTGVGQAGIGVMAATVGLEIDAPVEASPAADARIGGPSAGLMLALATYAAESGETLGDGRVIAGTGTIDLSGNVGPVDGIPAKARGAELAGAEVFLVPEAHAEVARDTAPDGLEIIPVASLADAIETLTD